MRRKSTNADQDLAVVPGDVSSTALVVATLLLLRAPSCGTTKQEMALEARVCGIGLGPDEFIRPVKRLLAEQHVEIRGLAGAGQQPRAERFGLTAAGRRKARLIADLYRRLLGERGEAPQFMGTSPRFEDRLAVTPTAAAVAAGMVPLGSGPAAAHQMRPLPTTAEEDEMVDFQAILEDLPEIPGWEPR